MYTFIDKGERSLTLRPEGTASAVRSAIEHGLLNDALPLKICYVTPCFRYEKPQAGRLREFHQFGVELFGPSGPSADAEIILVATALLKRLGIHDLRTEINSIGCPECRPRYHRALREYFESHKERLCETCQGRLWKNPMRILDCKSPICQTLSKDAPNITEFLCPACHEHFEGLKQRLSAAGVHYTVNPRIVRGLDYYTRTVFELISTKLGAQGTVCGGGRYDGLVQELGGNPTPALGFAMGLGKREKTTGFDTRGHQIIPRPLRSGFNQNRGFYFQKTIPVIVIPRQFYDLVPQPQHLLHIWSAEVQVSIFQPQFFIGCAVFLNGEGGRRGFCQQPQIVDVYLYLAGRKIGIDRFPLPQQPFCH